ncbi:unnamed protein product [Penicillium salamii]|nr:unnamed protein product [Penicillium salamii]CAG8429373.1 unnamed protein product [Penicillium salamii]
MTSPSNPLPSSSPAGAPNRDGSKSPEHERLLPDPDRLAPEDAYFAPALSRVRSAPTNYEESLRSMNGDNASHIGSAAALRKKLGAPRRRKRKGAWKKLLWVKQSYPDNYTDTETFLDHLQRNPRVRPYDFWPLVADSTVIVQHVCSVVIFVCCFVSIVQDRVSPVSIVCWGSVGTAVGWILWDNWIWKEHEESLKEVDRSAGADDGSSSTSFASVAEASANDIQTDDTKINTIHGLGLSMSGNESKEQLARRSADFSDTLDTDGLQTEQYASFPVPSNPLTGNTGSTDATVPHDTYDTYRGSMLSPRNRQRLTTVKSALLIYLSLLGLSPILKSLTKSTASDSIWAMSCWLLIMNIFSFDYGSGEGAGATTKFPASLSTNAAVMASTVLASRLPSTTHVFSLMLFSMEVFGLFPIFRRQLRQKSWTGHVVLTLTLVIVAGGAVGVTLSGGWAAAIIGSVLGSILTAFVMGGCSWWLISLQKYKNVVIGPWDPARPIIRRHWN